MAILNLFGGNKEKQDKARDKNRYEEEEDIKSRSSRRRKGEGDRERKSKSKSKSKNSEKEFDNFSKSKSSKARGEYETRERRETFSSKQRKKSRVPTEAAKWSESGYDDIILTEQEISYMKYKNKHRHRSNSLETRDTKQSKHEKREKGRSESRMKKHVEEEEHTKSHHRRHRSKSVVSRHNADEKQRSSSRYRKRSPSVHSKRKDERMENERNDKKRDKARSFSRSRRRSKSTIRSDYRSYDVPSTSKDHGRRDEISQRSKSRQRRRSASWDGYIKDVNGEKSRESRRNGQQTGYRDKSKHPVSDERVALSTSPTYVRESKHEKQIKNGNSKEHSKEDGHREITRGRLKESNRYYDAGENMNGLKNNETKSTSSVKKIVQRFNHKGMEETSARVTNIREGRGRIPKCALDKNVLSQIKSIRQDYDTSENVKAVAQHHNGKHLADTAARETRDDSVPLEGRDKDLKTSIDTSASKLSPIQQRWNCDKCGSANNSKGPFCVVCGGKSRNGNRGETGDPKINHVAPPNNQYRSSDEKFAKAQISLRSPTMNPEAWRCGSCGNVNENSRKSCVNCGNEKMFPSQTNMNYSTSDILIKGTGGEDALVASSETETSGHLRRPRTISPMTVGNETRGDIGAILSYTPREDYPPSFRDHGDVDVAQLTISPKSSTFHGQRAWNKTESDQNLSILSNMSTPAASWLCNFCKIINTSSGPFCCQCGQNRNNNNVTTNGLAFVKQQEAVRDFDSNNSVSSRNDFSRCSPRDFMQATVWKCRCLHVNDLTRKFCERCRGANPASTFHQNMVVENDNFAAPLVQNHMWECSSCLRLNESQRSRCQFCGEIKTMMAHNDSISVSSSLQSRTQKVNKPVEHVEKEWVCKSCSSYNFKDRKFCMNCGAKRILDENKDLKNVGTAASTRRDEGYFSQSNIMPRPIASYPTSSAQDYRSQELKMAIDGPYEQCQNYENHRYLSQNNQQRDQRHETRQMQMHEGQYRVNRADSDRVHTSTTQSVRSVDHGEPQNMNTSLILPQKGQKDKENSGPMMRKTNMESYTTPQNNPFNDRNNSRIPKSALSLSVLADISSGKATLKKAVVESNKEEATTLLSQIKKGKNLKSVKGKMCDDRSPRKNDRPMTILDQIKSGPKLKKVEKSNPSNSSREDNNSSALGSIFARRKILVGSKQDSAKSEFDSEEWS